jgi:phosphate:Na+ symporter
MEFLSGNVKKFSELESFREVFLTLSNPIWGILFGIVFTAIIQSSTAATAVLQSFAIQGLVPFPAAFALLLGFNIGTTSTGLLASIGTGKNARRTSIMHVCFNVIAVIFCFTVMTVLNEIFKFSWWNNSTSSLWIALIGLFVNVAAALLFLPFPKLLPKLAMFFMPDKASDIISEEEELSDSFANALDRRFVMSPSIAIQQAQNTVVKMGELAKTNLEKALELYKTYSKKTLENINKREEIIDSLEDKLNEYLVMITEKSLSDVENRSVTALQRLLIEFERIGDDAINIAERAEYMHSKNMSFSDTAEEDFQQLGVAIQEITQMAITAVGYSDLDTVMNIEPLEQTIDQIVDKIRERHIGRLKEGICTIDRGITFLNNIADMERVSDHCSNIAVYVLGKLAQKDIVDRHNYIDRMHKGEIPGYSEKLAEYMAKYSV